MKYMYERINVLKTSFNLFYNGIIVVLFLFISYINTG